MPTKDELKIMQALPLDLKVMKTQARLREFIEYYGEENCEVSFSGGKDSTVLMDIARKMYPNIKAVFVNTGLEYPEIQSFVKSFDNVDIIRPKMRFDEVIKKYGYPFISKEVANTIYWAKRGTKTSSSKMERLNGTWKAKDGTKSMFNCEKWKPLLYVDFELSDRCCAIMKKLPAKSRHKNQIVATMAEESRLRTQGWLKNGCNAFGTGGGKSAPMSFWTEQDVLRYIKENGLEIASVYGNVVGCDEQMSLFDNQCKLKCSGCNRTGCIFCAYGSHLEEESRFERLKITHPKQYEYCMGGGGYDENGIWKPTKDGLGMSHCIDELNKIYGKDFIRY